jgi:hypothetical protein
MTHLAAPDEGLRCRVVLGNGAEFDGPLSPTDHRSLHLQMLHTHTRGWIELTPGTATEAGKARIDRRKEHRHYLPGPDRRPHDWLARLLRHADRIVAGDFQARWRERLDPPRESAHIGVTGRQRRPRGLRKDPFHYGGIDNVTESHFLWVDVDGDRYLDRLWALTERFPPHLIVMSGGSGGAHVYWRLNRPLAATVTDPATGEPISDPETGKPMGWIERANARLIHHLGRDDDGNYVADWQCRDRSRVMRLAGTINWKSGRYAQVKFADFHRPGYAIGDLIGDLEDPPPKPKPPRPKVSAIDGPDPYDGIPAVDYYERFTGREVGRGLVRCPHADHEDHNPSCSLGSGATATVWKCHGCGRGGGIYQMASAVLGGPTEGLRGDAFKAAQQLVIDHYGDRRPERPKPSPHPARRRERIDAGALRAPLPTSASKPRRTP